MTTRGTRPQVFVLADVPSPHQNVFFDAIAELGEVDLEVAFCRRTMPGRAWSSDGPKRAKHRFLAETMVAGVPTNPGVIPHLMSQPQRLPFVVGYYLPGMVSAIAFLLVTRRRWVFWTDTLPPRRAATSMRGRMAGGLRHLSIHAATACLSTGRRGRDALIANGAHPDRAFEIPFVVDRDWIQASVDRQLPTRAKLRVKLGIPRDARLLLYVGQLIHRKGLDLLIDALAATPQLHALLIGSGEEEAALRARAATLAERVHFMPNMPNAELPPYWAAADVFVLPSRFDAWPVVVVEALTAGLPVLGSDACGSVVDRVVAGKTGWIFETGSSGALVERLRAIEGLTPQAIEAMRPAARMSMEPYSPRAMAGRFTEVVSAVQAMRP